MASIIVLNIGSSTVKFAFFELVNNTLNKTHSGVVDGILTQPVFNIEDLTTSQKQKTIIDTTHGDPYEKAIYSIIDWAEANNIEIVAAGHRFIHGGSKYPQATVLDAHVINKLEELCILAPLHQPYNIKGYKILHHRFPNICHVGSFDSSFHTTCNPLSQLFAIPKHLTEEGIKRYGYHGLSYAYVVSQFDKYLPKEQANGKVIVMHLGNGATMCGIDNRKSVATSVGFSAVDGLVMGTRCGSIDAGALVYLMENHGMDAKRINKLIFKESGLLGVSGISADMRDLLASSSPDAKLAVDLFVYRIAQWIGTLTAELQGIDALVFTGGIGENARPVREQICERAKWLGVKLDLEKNQAVKNGAIHDQDSKLGLYVIPTDEETTLAKNTLSFYEA